MPGSNCCECLFPPGPRRRRLSRVVAKARRLGRDTRQCPSDADGGPLLTPITGLDCRTPDSDPRLPRRRRKARNRRGVPKTYNDPGRVVFNPGQPSAGTGLGCSSESPDHTREARIWYSRDPNQPLLPGGFENVIVLSDEFYREVTAHSIPTDLEAAKALSSAPAALDLYMWLSYRCFTAKRQERIPIFGEFGLVAQLGSAEYARPRKFRERLDHWLDLIRCLWPGCPAQVSRDGESMLVQPAMALAAKEA